jgi:uncharacterized protein YndB with AHSA1/START domain
VTTRPVLASPAPILLLILAIPVVVSAFTLAAGPPPQQLMTGLAIVVDIALIVGFVVFLANVRRIPADATIDERLILRRQAVVLIFGSIVIASFALILAIALPAAGLLVCALAMAWIILWLPPRFRRKSSATSYVIKRSPEAVFEFVADPRNAPRWAVGIVSVEMLTPEPIGAGSRFQEHGRLPEGRKIEAVEEIVDYEPSRRMSSRLLNRRRPHLATYTFEPVDSGTQLTFRFDFERSVSSALLGSWFWRARVERKIQARREQSRIRLAQILEGDEA